MRSTFDCYERKRLRHNAGTKSNHKNQKNISSAGRAPVGSRRWGPILGVVVVVDFQAPARYDLVHLMDYNDLSLFLCISRYIYDRGVYIYIYRSWCIQSISGQERKRTAKVYGVYTNWDIYIERHPTFILAISFDFYIPLTFQQTTTPTTRRLHGREREGKKTHRAQTEWEMLCVEESFIYISSRFNGLLRKEIRASHPAVRQTIGGSLKPDRTILVGREIETPLCFSI